MFENIHLNTVFNSVLIYLFILVGIRLLGKKELGQISVADLIFVMLISEVVGNAMLASDESLLGGLIAATTLMLVNKFLKVLTFKSKKFSILMEGRPAVLIRHGELNMKEMRKNRVSVEDLEQAGRQNGIGNISTIALAILEADGKISILEDEKIRTSIKMDE